MYLLSASAKKTEKDEERNKKRGRWFQRETRRQTYWGEEHWCGLSILPNPTDITITGTALHPVCISWTLTMETIDTPESSVLAWCSAHELDSRQNCICLINTHFYPHGLEFFCLQEITLRYNLLAKANTFIREMWCHKNVHTEQISKIFTNGVFHLFLKNIYPKTTIIP